MSLNSNGPPKSFTSQEIGAWVHAAQEQHAKKRIVEAPCEMARDRYKDAALAWLEGPEERPWCPLFNTAGKQVDPARIAFQAPVTFVVKGNLVEVAGNGMALAALKAQLERSVSKPGLPRAPRQANALGEARSIFAAVDGFLEHCSTPFILFMSHEFPQLCLGGRCRLGKSCCHGARPRSTQSQCLHRY